MDKRKPRIPSLWKGASPRLFTERLSTNNLKTVTSNRLTKEVMATSCSMVVGVSCRLILPGDHQCCQQDAQQYYAENIRQDKHGNPDPTVGNSR